MARRERLNVILWKAHKKQQRRKQERQKRRAHLLFRRR